MKFEFSAVLLAVLAANNAMGAEILKSGIYFTEGCSGEPLVQAALGFGNQCLKLTPSTSAKYSCSEMEIFSTAADCTGASSKTAVNTGCVSAGGVSTKNECVTVPDGKIAKLSVGTACSDGEITGVVNEAFVVLDECTSFSAGAEVSFKYSAVDGGLKFTMFTEKNDCTGASESATIPIGECTLTSSGPVAGRRLQGGGEIAILVTPAVEGATLGSGSSAMSASASAFAFVVAMLGAFATMA